MIYVLGGGVDNRNFDVIGSTMQPGNPKENTIWVNTGAAVTAWDFSETEPSAAEGKVWFSIGSAKDSSAPLNADKKNVLMVYPVAAKQYVNGAWVDAKAKTYQNGAWIDWWDGELYIRGKDYTNITGGWVVGNVPPPGWNSYKSATLTKNAANMVLKGRLNTLYSGKKIDVTNYKTMVFKGSVNKWSTIRIKPTKDSQENGAYGDWSVGQTERRVDISGLSGSHYICLSIYDADNSSITLTEVYME